MGQGFDERELRRRAIDGVREEIEAFGSAAAGSRLLPHEGVVASLAPVAPHRSLFNSVFYEHPDALAAGIKSLGETYDSHGIQAWTVWVPDEDRDTAAMLEGRGHKLDAAPRAMATPLDGLGPEPPPPSGVEMRPGDPGVAAELNDLAYGYGPDGFRAALSGPTAIQWFLACEGEEALGCVGAIEIGDDCCITGVATPAEHRGRGIASWLLWRVLVDARERGQLTGSLQATKAGAPLYERLGFRDFGFIEMWELRK